MGEFICIYIRQHENKSMVCQILGSTHFGDLTLAQCHGLLTIIFHKDQIMSISKVLDAQTDVMLTFIWGAQTFDSNCISIYKQLSYRSINYVVFFSVIYLYLFPNVDIIERLNSQVSSCRCIYRLRTLSASLSTPASNAAPRLTSEARPQQLHSLRCSDK